MWYFTQTLSQSTSALSSSKGFPEPLVICRWSNLQQIPFQHTFLASIWTHTNIFHPSHFFQRIPGHTTICCLRKHLQVVLNPVPASIIWRAIVNPLSHPFPGWKVLAYSVFPYHSSLPFCDSLYIFNKYCLLQVRMSATFHTEVVGAQQTFTVTM